MKSKKLISVITIMSMAVMILSACAKNNTSDGNKHAYPGTPEEGSITVNISTEPPEMFSVTMTNSTSFTVLRRTC